MINLLPRRFERPAHGIARRDSIRRPPVDSMAQQFGQAAWDFLMSLGVDIVTN